MKEQDYLETILSLTKSINNLYCYGSIESSNKKVFDLMLNGLNESLEMQHNLFEAMKNNNLYKIKNANSTKIKSTLSQIKNC